ncbi:MAG TPA: SprT-like domain-containing protein [Terriglobales bacterium]|nr:SprT-like domain-containing protein [Terriglobales bacterium]
MSDRLLRIFQETHRELRPRSLLPQVQAEFFSFANINNTIRLRDGILLVRISDLLEGAPDNVLRAIAHILLAKMYRKPIEREQATRYRRYVSQRDIREKAHLLRQIRGRKHIDTAHGQTYNLESIFDELNLKYFHGLLARPQMTWSRDQARNSLGHYDPAHNAIVISRIFDHPRVPRPAVEYIVYHEMLHLKHPVKVRGGRRCVHSAEFQAEEKLFPRLEEAKQFLKAI